MRSASFLAAVLLLLCFSALSAKEPDLIVHEWGTFTVLQDEQGKELPGINTDDEPVPGFVHDLAPNLLAQPLLTDLHWQYRQKGAPRHHPLVLVRLETPVIYFYPRDGKPLPSKIDVKVMFRGGWLTQFYPQAEFTAPEFKDSPFDFGQLSARTTGTLSWNDLSVGTSAAGPETDDPVWLHPRKVKAAGVTSQGGESEKYLFYRGVGHQRAPLSVSLDRKAKEISIRGNFLEVLEENETASIDDLWIVSVLADGTCRYRRLDRIRVNDQPDEVYLKTSYAFDPNDKQDQKAELEKEMHTALAKDGLYSDEATALLSTWQKSYFSTVGLRIFYLVPRQWTDHYLPLSITGDPPLVRSMVGRIELIGDEQRALLTKMAKTTPSSPEWVDKIPSSPARDRFLAGRSNFGDLGVKIPDDYQLYLALGRFRNALVTAEERRTRSTNLGHFIDNYALHPFRIAPESEK